MIFAIVHSSSKEQVHGFTLLPATHSFSCNRQLVIGNRLLPFQQLYNDHYQRKKEHEQGDPVNAVHKTHGTGMRHVGIALLNVKVFGYLSPYTHNAPV
jgi:hypothetical protein